MGILLADIGGESCEPVAGLEGVLYYGLRSSFTTITDPKDICGDLAGADFSELVEIAASPGHTMATNKKLHTVTFTPETSGLTTTMIGERRRRLFENMITGEISGSNAELLGFLRWARNKDLVFFIKEFGSGQARQLGSARMGAWIEGIEGAIEALAEGKNGVTLTLKDKQKWPAPIYLGTLDTTGNDSE